MHALAMLPILLAADPVEPLGGAIPGGAGFVGAGLLGAVLGWLLFWHLPAKDKQIKELIDSRDAAVAALAKDYRASLLELTQRFIETDKERRTDYKESLQTIVSHCEKESSMNGESIRKGQAELTAMVVTVRQLVEEVREEVRKTRGA